MLMCSATSITLQRSAEGRVTRNCSSTDRKWPSLSICARNVPCRESIISIVPDFFMPQSYRGASRTALDADQEIDYDRDRNLLKVSGVMRKYEAISFCGTNCSKCGLRCNNLS